MPKQMRQVIGALAVAVIVVAIVALNSKKMTPGNSASETSSPLAAGAPKNFVNQEVVAELRPMASKCKDVLRQLQSSGVVGDVKKTSYGAIFVEFDEPTWNAAIYRKKIDYALTMYCAHMPPDGKLTVTLRGLRTHDTLARVIDGNYWSGF